MRTLPLVWLLLASQLLVGCESLGLHVPWERDASTPDAAEEGEANPVNCPLPEQVVCAEPEVKVVERVIERRIEKVVEVPVAKDRLVLGSVESASIEPGGLVVDALVDTGAATSSLSASELVSFERDGSEWVRFKLVPPNGDKADPISIELPVKRTVRVMRPGFGSQKRPIVDMSLTIGEVTHMVEVNLTDRSGLDYLLLVGRNFLKDAAVVDVSRQHVQGPPKSPTGK